MFWLEVAILGWAMSIYWIIFSKTRKILIEAQSISRRLDVLELRTFGLDNKADEILKKEKEVRVFGKKRKPGIKKGSKSNMSEEARKRNSERMKKRWAEKRAAGKFVKPTAQTSV